MKKTIFALAAIAFSGAVLAGGVSPMAAPAAQDSMYYGFHADMTSSFDNITVNRVIGSANAPMRFNQGGFQVGMLFGAIRAELSVDYNSQVLAGAANATSTLDAFVKGAYDLQLGHGVAIYPVAGIGLTYYFNQATVARAGTDFSWLLGAGATLSLNDKTSISGEYNYVHITSDTSRTQLGTRTDDIGQNVFSIRWNRTF